MPALEFNVTTTGIPATVVLGDLGGRELVHPTTVDLLAEFTLLEIVRSIDLAAAITGAEVTVADADSKPVLDSRRTFLRAEAGNIYRVATSGAPYTSIQDAIDQAVADGAAGGDPTAAKLVLVEPGQYTENITIAAGVTVRGMMKFGAFILPANTAANTVTVSVDGFLSDIFVCPPDNPFYAVDTASIVENVRIAPLGPFTGDGVYIRSAAQLFNVFSSFAPVGFKSDAAATDPVLEDCIGFSHTTAFDVTAASQISVKGCAAISCTADLGGTGTLIIVTPSFLRLFGFAGAVFGLPVQNTVRTITFADTPYGAVLGEIVLVNATAGAVTVVLPDATTSEARPVTVKKIDASANAVTVDGNGAQTIDGAANYPLAAQWDAVTTVTDGTNNVVI